ncbi:uncharacterized protein LOC142652566 [Rhinoderma darwinii]|uniref:uncharacterized protein LOC142652566 n=1 Tax=Rhinoderma darwinii TaxID=43563 RepID=UPI003F681F4B
MDDVIAMTKSDIKNVISAKGKEVIFNAKVQCFENDEKCSRFFFKKVVENKGMIVEMEGKKTNDKILVEELKFYQDLFNKKTIDHSFTEDLLNAMDLKLEKSDQESLCESGAIGHGFPPGPGSWKLNCALLEREEVLAELRDAYIVWRNDKVFFDKTCDWWEYVKVEFRCFFQAKSRQQACERKRDFREMQRQLRPLQDLLQCGWDVRKELEEAKKGLKRHFEEESKRIVFRSKVENLEKGEKCNSFFFRKLHAGHTPLKELRDETGNMHSGKKEVMGVVTDYYRSLYSRKTTDPEAADKFLSELFAEAIRQNGEIRGITAPGPGHFEVKCSLYMDDVTVFCADQSSVTALVQTCEEFGRASGAKVNCGKSEAMLFGKWYLPSPASFPFTIKPDFIKILGVWFGKEGAALKSWEERLAKVNQRIGLWSLRQLTIEGKAMVLRNEVLPVLQYTAQAWPPLATVSRAITRTVFRFIWGSKMDRVKRTVMYKEPRKGGKGIPDIPTLLRIAFVCDCVRRTLRTANGSAGKAMSRYFLLPLWRGFGWDKWDSSFPYNWHAPWFYGDVVRFVREHQLEGLKPDLWKPKTIHKHIRAKDSLESVPGLHADTLETVWTNVSSGRLTNGHKDISWMAIQGGLPLRSFMHARNLCKTRYCPRCPFTEETSLHIFWQCPFAQGLLKALEHELKDSVPRNRLSYRSVLYGLFPGNTTDGAIQEAWRLMNCFKDAIWFARNRLILRRESVSVQDCRRLIHSLLRDYSTWDSPDVDEEED